MHFAMMPCTPSHSPCPEGEHVMVSLDGETWREITRLPIDDAEREALRADFAAEDSRGWKAIVFARRYLDARGARYL